MPATSSSIYLLLALLTPVPSRPASRFVSEARPVSVHVYARPYDECDIYDIDAGVVEQVLEPGKGLVGQVVVSGFVECLG